MATARRVIVIGLDGLEPTLVSALWDAGALPHLRQLRDAGGCSTVATTSPAQTPVAWSSFATGVNPGGHGIFDFIRRDPARYAPDLALNRYEQKNAFSPPRAVSLRRGTPVWQILSEAGIPSTILRCPCSYPPDTLRGRMLSGMGVPDLAGGLGTSTLFTANPTTRPRESERVVHLDAPRSGSITVELPGMMNPRTRKPFTCPLTIQMDGDAVRVRADGSSASVAVPIGQWSGWLKVRFKTGLMQSVRGMARFYLCRLDPTLELYASPVNFDPESPMFPISTPPAYAAELEKALGPYYTTGMVEDHTGLNNERIDESALLAQCEEVVRERSRMLDLELSRSPSGLVFCLFDTPDRIQHMFWRYRAANGRPPDANFGRVIEDHYARCDQIVGDVLKAVDDQTLLIVLSDHGFNRFDRGVHLNTWLHDHGFLTLKPGVAPGEEAGDFLRQVDWDQTKAYSLGLSGIYLNLRGREANGIVDPAGAAELSRTIAGGLAELVDAEKQTRALRGVSLASEIYRGPYTHEAPDLVVNFASGYRSSWATALGGIPRGHFEDNVKKWSGDHIIDPELVPGILLLNRPFRGSGARLIDLAPTILDALGVPRTPQLEGVSLLHH